MDTPIDVDEDNQWKQDSKFIIIKIMYGTCFIFNFSREIDWEWSQICQRPPSYAHRRRQPQPGRIPQVDISYFKKHIWRMFHIQFFKRNRFGRVSDMSEASQSCSSTSTTSTRPSLTSGYVIFKKKHMTHVLYPIFQEKSIGKGLRYVRGLLVMFIDVDNVNVTESHKWVLHIWTKNHIWRMFYIPFFVRKMGYKT